VRIIYRLTTWLFEWTSHQWPPENDDTCRRNVCRGLFIKVNNKFNGALVGTCQFMTSSLCLKKPMAYMNSVHSSTRQTHLMFHKRLSSHAIAFPRVFSGDSFCHIVFRASICKINSSRHMRLQTKSMRLFSLPVNTSFQASDFSLRPLSDKIFVEIPKNDDTWKSYVYRPLY
jgi:hypothetical protein